jgi:glutaminase
MNKYPHPPTTDNEFLEEDNLRKAPMPSHDDIAAAVREGYQAALATSGGKNADYVPFLASVPSDLCGIAVVARNGQVFTEGDTDYPFALESISKVTTLALAMEEIGPQGIQDKVGVDPTGLSFNSVLALELHSGRPLSPLVNAGAISTVSLVPATSVEERWNKILDFQSRMAGHPLRLSEEVYRSEQMTNFHNRAIAWLLQCAGYAYIDPMEALDVYTRQCSTLVTCLDLATIGATLANKGINPKTRERVVSAGNVPHILAQMMMEGLYTYSGDFAYSVGLPGKSGVGGGLVAVAPGKLAIAAFSPQLDEAGNSVRGLVGISEVAKRLRLNVFEG